MQLDLLKQLNAARRERRAAILDTDTRTGEARHGRAEAALRDPLAVELEKRLRSGRSGMLEDPPQPCNQILSFVLPLGHGIEVQVGTPDYPRDPFTIVPSGCQDTGHSRAVRPVARAIDWICERRANQTGNPARELVELYGRALKVVVL